MKIKKRVLMGGIIAVLLLTALTTRAAEIAVSEGATDALKDDGLCSLREALINANNDEQTYADCTAGDGDDTIKVPAMTYTFLIDGNDDNAEMGDLDIRSDVTIVGEGADETIINADGKDSVFSLIASTNPTVTLRNLRITGGANSGIYLKAQSSATVTLNLEGVTVSGNSAESKGAGLYLVADEATVAVTIKESSISANEISYNEITGKSYAYGIGIYAYALDGGSMTVTIEKSTISNNESTVTPPSAKGGGIFFESYAGSGNARLSVTISDTTISENVLGSTSGAALGGGLYAWAVASSGYSSNLNLSVLRSTISENTLESTGDDSRGAGLYLTSSGTGRSTLNGALTNSTVSGNTASGANYAWGGGIYADATLALANVTIADNVAHVSGTSGTTYGGGIYRAGTPTVSIKNTIIANNTADKGPDCWGTISGGDYSLIYDMSGCSVDDDITLIKLTKGDDPLLIHLFDNGGLTETMGLDEKSPAIDAGDPEGCTDADGNSLTTDQRGALRDGQCDIGAFEYGGGEGECSDGSDNDNDGFTDSEDSDCGGTETSCTDGADNDGDDDVDCDDSDCSTDTACVKTDCSDGNDNDGDDKTDCDDSDCTDDAACATTETGTASTTTTGSGTGGTTEDGATADEGTTTGTDTTSGSTSEDEGTTTETDTTSESTSEEGGTTTETGTDSGSTSADDETQEPLVDTTTNETEQATEEDEATPTTTTEADTQTAPSGGCQLRPESASRPIDRNSSVFLIGTLFAFFILRRFLSFTPR